MNLSNFATAQCITRVLDHVLLPVQGYRSAVIEIVDPSGDLFGESLDQSVEERAGTIELRIDPVHSGLALESLLLLLGFHAVFNVAWSSAARDSIARLLELAGEGYWMDDYRALLAVPGERSFLFDFMIERPPVSELLDQFSPLEQLEGVPELVRHGFDWYEIVLDRPTASELVVIEMTTLDSDRVFGERFLRLEESARQLLHPTREPVEQSYALTVLDGISHISDGPSVGSTRRVGSGARDSGTEDWASSVADWRKGCPIGLGKPFERFGRLQDWSDLILSAFWPADRTAGEASARWR